jgi:hypothetical protein
MSGDFRDYRYQFVDDIARSALSFAAAASQLTRNQNIKKSDIKSPYQCRTKKVINHRGTCEHPKKERIPKCHKTMAQNNAKVNRS